VSVKTRSFGLGLSFVILTLTGIFFLLGAQGFLTKGEMREITLVAKEMSFQIAEFGTANDDNTTPQSAIPTPHSNPTLTFRPGERVRITLRNEDQGVLHDIVIVSTNSSTPIFEKRLPRMLQYGETESFTFTVPQFEQKEIQNNLFEYYCSSHPEMMKGDISIEPGK
jgi:plastocyanin